MLLLLETYRTFNIKIVEKRLHSGNLLKQLSLHPLRKKDAESRITKSASSLHETLRFRISAVKAPHNLGNWGESLRNTRTRTTVC